MKNIKFAFLGFSFLLISIILLSLTSCNKKKWTETTDVSISSKLSTNQLIIANNLFEINNLSVNIGEIRFTGSRLQAEDISLHSDDNVLADFNLNENIIDLKVPQGTYENQQIQLNLLSNSVGTIEINGLYFLNNGDTNVVNINLNGSQLVQHNIKDSDGEETILLEKDNPRGVNIEINTEFLFSEINNGLWNAASITSVNGSNTIVVDQLNNQSIYLALLNKIPASFSSQYE